MWPSEGLRLDEFFLNYFLISRQKHVKTFANCAPVNLDLVTRVQFFIELLIVLWFKEWVYFILAFSRSYIPFNFSKKLLKVAISPIIMVLEANQFMAKNLKTKILRWSMMYQAYCPWRMLARELTVLSYGIYYSNDCDTYLEGDYWRSQWLDNESHQSSL